MDAGDLRLDRPPARHGHRARQDTDPAQVALLQALAGGGRDLVAVGDPDQSIYAFRGADVGGIGRFPAEFRTRDDADATVLALTTTRRFGPRLLAASRAVADRLGAPAGVPSEVVRQFRSPRSVEGAPDCEVDVRTYVSAVAEAEQIAAELRRAHLSDGVDWSDMAVLVRSGAEVLPRLQRALTAAGVPTEVAADEVPLRSDPAVRPLLQALRLVVTAAGGRSLEPQDAVDVLTGPLGALDASALRRVSRALRHLAAEPRDDDEVGTPDAAGAGAPPATPEPPRPSRELLAEALLEPTTWTRLDVDGAATGLRFARVLVDAVAQVAAGATPDEVLWTLWSGTGWRTRLERAVDRGGDQARAAHRDLDAVCALFDVAARADEHRRRTGVAAFLAEVEDQQIPGQSLAEAGVRGSAVRLLTAHRSKGLEWRLVVVAGVQEGSWPIVRARGSLLQPDRLDRDGTRPPATLAERVAEERRLFYVAITRARERLLVTAVASPYDDGEQPSRFVTDLCTHLRAPEAPGARPEESPLPVALGRPRRPLSLRGVVAELRRIAESSTDEGVRAAAADRLALLAAPRTDGGARVAAARPDRWTGVRDVTVNALPLLPPDEPVPLSASALSAIVGCPLSWYLARQCQGEEAGTAAQGFGSLVHAVAADVVRTGVEPDAEQIDARLEEFWARLDHVAPWISARERVEARVCVERFAEWHRRAAEGRTVLAGEHAFEVEVPVGGDRARLRGSMDRVELAVDGRVHVVDLKTGRRPVGGAELRVHPQLALYQVAVDHGAADGLVDGAVTSGGASLVQLRVAEGAKAPEMPKVQAQTALADADPEAVVVHEQLAAAVALVRTQQVTATPGAACEHCHFHRLCPAQPEGRTVLDLEVTR